MFSMLFVESEYELKKSIISLETIEGIFWYNLKCIRCNTSHSFGLCLLSVDLNEIEVMHTVPGRKVEICCCLCVASADFA